MKRVMVILLCGIVVPAICGCWSTRPAVIQDITGTVIYVLDKADVAILNVGRENGVQIGMHFEISRSHRNSIVYCAEAIVTRVYASTNMCCVTLGDACTSGSLRQNGVQIGDNARLISEGAPRCCRPGGVTRGRESLGVVIRH